MALDYSWVLLICFGLTVCLTGANWLIRRNKELKTKSVVLFANTSRLTKTVAYNNAMKAYKLGIVGVVAFIVLSSLGAAIVAAKPVNVTRESPIKYNRDIVLCLDVSGSMTYVDSQIVDKFKKLADGFKGERLSLVVFNSVSNQVFPLTDDYEYIQKQLDRVALGLDTLGTGTAHKDGYDFDSYTLGGEGSSLIGDGLAACTMGFDKDNADGKRSKSVVLATDNVVFGEEIINLDDAAKLAKKEGVKVYGINPVTYETAAEGEALKTAVESTGGQYYDLSDGTAITGIVDKITSEQTSAIKGDEVVIKTDMPQGWIIFSGLFFLAAMVLAWRFKV